MTVTSMGLPVAPEAVIRIVPVRSEPEVLYENSRLIVPLFVPLDPDAIESQLSPDRTEAVQFMSPLAILSTLTSAVTLSASTV